MSRPRSEQNFGSDSFLDVVCNVVGILIILMVIAGVRASRSPVLLSAGPVMDAEALSPSPASFDELTVELGAAEPLRPAAPAVETMPAQPSPALVAEDERLRGEMSALTARSDEAVAELTAVHEQQSQWEERLAKARDLVSRKRAALQSAQQALAATAVELSQLRQTVDQLRLEVDQTEANTPKLQQIEHRITPIGQTVTGRELHFQMLHGRVAVIPLEPLIERLKDQVERRKEWLAKSRQHLGEVGPINGFTMTYVVQRDNLTVVDELRFGQGMFRISVSSWQLRPEADLVTESVAQAMQPGSRFYAALLEAGDNAALTFWVYPDSFEAFGELKRFCHTQNFLVAGRPLPMGQPISGSPTGSRSAGQ